MTLHFDPNGVMARDLERLANCQHEHVKFWWHMGQDVSQPTQVRCLDCLREWRVGESVADTPT